MTIRSTYTARGRARVAALLAGAVLLASCGQQRQDPAPRLAPTAAVAPLPVPIYFGAQFCEECISASDEAPVQAF